MDENKVEESKVIPQVASIPSETETKLEKIALKAKKRNSKILIGMFILFLGLLSIYFIRKYLGISTSLFSPYYE